MTFLSRITRVPLALNPDLACDLPILDATLRELTNGMAGSSPYLRSLLLREAEWFSDAARRPPEEIFADILASVPEEAPLNTLRLAKRRGALLLAACDLAGVWTLEEVTGALTQLADLAVGRALDARIAAQHACGQLPFITAAAAGLVVLAMGKMGARELNYSSDIDLICLFDAERLEPADYEHIRFVFQKVVRDTMHDLSMQKGDGYVFRTDLRLRPNPAVTPVCVPIDAAERYYESEGRTWERAAFIKARAAAGDLAEGAAFLDRLKPFIWRRHLDFNAIRDAHDMRLAIRELRNLACPIIVSGHDMKLGRGGIREIEFFAQTRQLISGGRDAGLRQRGTVGALAALAAKSWITDDVAHTLTAAYRAHRETEHRIQMLRDAQTHQMPAGGDALDQVARLSGWADTYAYAKDQQARLEQVNAIIEGFFTPRPIAAESAPEIPRHKAIMDSWSGLPAFRSARAIEAFDRFRPALAVRINGRSNPDATLDALDTFMRGLPAGVQLFALFEAKPQLLDLLLDVCATSPALSDYLSRNTNVLDAVISGGFFDLPDSQDWQSSLSLTLQAAGDFEEALLCARCWQKEQHFRVGVLLLRRMAELEEVEAGYSDLAQAVLCALVPVVEAEVIRRYGRFRSQSVAVLAMGKLGSAQMTATSDLDLIVVYDAEGECADGRQGLAPQQYFARFTQTLITALSSAMSEGRLYEVDMRLRPSGRQGPVAVSRTAFDDYQKTRACTWKRLALTRARSVAGHPGLRDMLEATRREVLGTPHDPRKVLRDVRDMRVRLTSAKGGKADVWEVKDRPGGLLELELAAQTLTLIEGKTERSPRSQLLNSRYLNKATAEVLVDGHRFLSAVQQAQRLLVDGAFDPARLGQDGQDFLCRFTRLNDIDAVLAKMNEVCARNATAVTEILRQRA
ncbi:MAG: glutamine-synthetase adenylyltransferase [Rhodobacteraceae bacterium]|nr:glutamine-synthetase adenylyltransferase [Paracoccaceae bacterium]